MASKNPFVGSIFLSLGVAMMPLGTTAAPIFSPADTVLGGQVSAGIFQVGAPGGVAGTNRNVWPAAESPVKCVDGLPQKYLNFGRENSGIVITPGSGSSVPRSLRVWTANDAPERDPTSYQLYGTNSPIGSGPFTLGDFELISSGPLELPDGRNTAAALDEANSGRAYLGNAAAYTSYIVVFPTVKVPLAGYAFPADSLQVGEIQLDSAPPDAGLVSEVAISAGLVAEADTAFTIATPGTTFENRIALFDQAGSLLGSADSTTGGGTASIEVPAGLASGTYYLAITGPDASIGSGFDVTYPAGSSPTGTWSMSSASAGISPIEASGPMSADQVVWLAVGVAPQVDERFGFIGFDETAVLVDSLNSTFTAGFGVYDSAGVLLATDEGSGQVVLPPLPSGVYFVALAGVEATFGPSFGASGGSGSGLWELDLFGDILSFREGDLSPGQVLWFSFEIADKVLLGDLALAGAPLVIDTAGSDYANGLAIYDEFGALLHEYHPSSGEATAIALPSGLEPGDYLIAIGGTDTSFNSDFGAIGGAASGDYFLNVPGKSLAGKQRSGQIVWYQLGIRPEPAILETASVEGGAPFTVSTFFAETAIDTEVAVFDVYGELLGTNDDGVGAGLTSILSAPLGLPQGSYYVAVGSWDSFFGNFFSASGGDESGTYRVSIGADTFTATLASNQIDWYKIQISEGEFRIIDTGIDAGGFYLDFESFDLRRYVLEELSFATGSPTTVTPLESLPGDFGVSRFRVAAPTGRRFFRVNDQTQLVPTSW